MGEYMAKRGSDNWKVISFFESQWSEEYCGAVYAKSGRDLRASKDFLELYPNFFEDEVLQSNAREWYKNYLKARFWYKPIANPPLYHPFWGFVQHLDKCQTPEKKNQFIPRPIKKRITEVEDNQEWEKIG
jgi:hypothetical protein